MGKPSSTNIYYDKEVFVYYIHDDFIDLLFTNKFPFIGFYPLLRTGKKHVVVLEDGHLISHGRGLEYKMGKDSVSIKGLPVK